jgi:DNA-directed RNA polymerase subunit RPC12/RpoP
MDYICFNCGKKVKDEYLKKRIRCPYCSGKILIKDRKVTTTIKAR